MEFWFLLLASLCLCSFHFFLKNLLQTKKLPPGPPTIPFVGNILWLVKATKNFSDIESVLRRLRSKYGPIITLYIGSHPSVFITNHAAAHQALVQKGTVFASRPPALETNQIITSNQHTIASAAYGSLWRLLRQNFVSIQHPSRLKSYSRCRKWALNILKDKLIGEAKSGKAIQVVDHFRHAIFCLLVYMCFGEKLEEKAVREMEAVQRPIFVNLNRFDALNFMPRLGKILFRKLWKELLQLRQNQENVIIPLIKARREKTKDEDSIVSYVDTLLNLQLPDDARKLSDKEMVSLCSEFFYVGNDTTTTTLQWIMANLVKHQDVQEKLVQEIEAVVKAGDEMKEEDLKRMPYLKAVVLETLRRHPPGHFTAIHAVTEDTVLDGYHIPRNALVNFTVADMARDAKVWEDPMAFKPERFLSNDGEAVFDIKGVREIKMMPFGAGRRACPAMAMAMLILKYFVANLIRDFKWTAKDGVGVDLTEKHEFAVVMKNPLRAHISPRI
ncbi:hypothetical protein L1049_005559 [Liquidambar formosana]|uniref:Cytochrome P450 n=1 Tax=Liquidambar formosana TaxID=63359 RepID=A0AAP0RFX7_LIQFO